MARWYIVHAYSGYEGKVKERILQDSVRLGLEAAVKEVVVPTESETVVRRGKKVETERKTLPGYVLVNVDMNEAVFHLISNTPRVTGFLGPSGKPQPITDKEAARILNIQDEEDTARPKVRRKVSFEIGDSLKVLDGPFASFTGIAEEIDYDRGRVKVSVSIFGRATPMELDFDQVEKDK